MKYFHEQRVIFVIGSIALLGGNFGELAVPYYVGLIVDSISKGDTDHVYTLAVQMAGIVLVRNQ